MPVHELPADYVEVEHLVLTARWNYLLLNLLALVPLAIGLIAMAFWWALVMRVRGPMPGPDVSLWARLVILLAVLPLHEWLHGVAIQRAGHKPRYGWKPSKMVLYATADNALFRRSEFLIVALAPLVGLTLLGMTLIAVLPDSLGYYVALAVMVNASSAIGDIVMVGALLRYPPSVLVRDEEDGIRIYQQTAPVTV